MVRFNDLLYCLRDSIWSECSPGGAFDGLGLVGVDAHEFSHHILDADGLDGNFPLALLRISEVNFRDGMDAVSSSFDIDIELIFFKPLSSGKQCEWVWKAQECAFAFFYSSLGCSPADAIPGWSQEIQRATGQTVNYFELSTMAYEVFEVESFAMETGTLSLVANVFVA